MLTGAEMDAILARYPHATAFQRWHMRGRLRLCPYDLLLPGLTGRGTLLDVGCGFGHLAWYLRQARPDLEYVGADIDTRKIDLAQGSAAATGGPRFLLGDVRFLSDLPETFGNIVFLDVLYLMPWELQKEMLAWALGCLAPDPGSAVVVKTMDEAKGFPGFRAVAEEWIMVKALRRTVSSGALNGARDASAYLDFAASLGFRGESKPLGTFNPSSVLRFTRD